MPTFTINTGTETKEIIMKPAKKRQIKELWGLMLETEKDQHKLIELQEKRDQLAAELCNMTMDELLDLPTPEADKLIGQVMEWVMDDINFTKYLSKQGDSLARAKQG